MAHFYKHYFSGPLFLSIVKKEDVLTYHPFINIPFILSLKFGFSQFSGFINSPTKWGIYVSALSYLDLKNKKKLFKNPLKRL